MQIKIVYSPRFNYSDKLLSLFVKLNCSALSMLNAIVFQVNYKYLIAKTIIESDIAYAYIESRQTKNLTAYFQRNK